ncbi:MAG: hypothetical protein NTX34_08360 [Cytophagales bacterium]|nr:hypothetical protein [Cytophagales bacterium]
MESPGAKFKDQSSKFKDGIAGGKVQRPKFKVQRWNRRGRWYSVAAFGLFSSVLFSSGLSDIVATKTKSTKPQATPY